MCVCTDLRQQANLRDSNVPGTYKLQRGHVRVPPKPYRLFRLITPLAFTKTPVSSDKYSHESEFNDELHFRTMSGRGTTLASTSVLPQNRGRSGFTSTEDWELSDKSAAAIEDEKLTETPDLPSV